MRDFSPRTLKALARKGITVIAPVAIPNMASAMPYANAERGYRVVDNGCGRILTFAQVIQAAR